MSCDAVISIRSDIVDRLDELRQSPDETMSDIIERLIHLAIDDETISDDEWLEIEKAEQEIREGKGIPGEIILKKFGIHDI